MSKRSARSLTAERAFHARVAELGGEVLEPTWLGNSKPHRVRCAAGHEGMPSPTNVQRGQGLCRICAGNDPATAERAFRARVAELGGEVLEPKWRGATTRHRVRCAAGHECMPSPASVRQGAGLCSICAGNDPATAERAFRARVAELGGEVLEPKWRGVDRSHRVRCAAGHQCRPRPSGLRGGKGICRICVGLDPTTAERAFRARVVELGGEVLEPEWRGATTRHRVRCAAGHECMALPNSVQQGMGICRLCAGKVWDAFYLVIDRARHRLKFGITSGAPGPRLRKHRRAGYVETVRLLIALPGGDAPELERAVLGALRMAGEAPAQGREYFDATVLALVLDVVDNYPAPGIAV
jgi:hypothetical protein